MHFAVIANSSNCPALFHGLPQLFEMLRNYFTKIVAAPADATLEDGTWYAADGSEIGPVIWGEFATIQEVYNDTGTGEHGVLYLSPYSAGFGRYSPQD